MEVPWQLCSGPSVTKCACSVLRKCENYLNFAPERMALAWRACLNVFVASGLKEGEDLRDEVARLLINSLLSFSPLWLVDASMVLQHNVRNLHVRCVKPCQAVLHPDLIVSVRIVFVRLGPT